MLFLGGKKKKKKRKREEKPPILFACLIHCGKTVGILCFILACHCSDTINFKSLLSLPEQSWLLSLVHNTCVSSSVCVDVWWSGPGDCSKREVSKIKSSISTPTNARSGSLCTWSVPLDFWLKGRGTGIVSLLTWKEQTCWIAHECAVFAFKAVSPPQLMVTCVTLY